MGGNLSADRTSTWRPAARARIWTAPASAASTGPADVQQTVGSTAKMPSRFMLFGRASRCDSR